MQSAYRRVMELLVRLQPDLEACARQRPCLEELLQRIHRFVQDSQGPAGQFDTDASPRYQTWTDEEVKELLNSEQRRKAPVTEGSVYSIEDIDVEQAERLRRTDIFEHFRACQIIFTSKEWEAIYLYYGRGQCDAEIAEILGIGRKAVTNRRRRAEKRKAMYDHQELEAKLRLLKKSR